MSKVSAYLQEHILGEVSSNPSVLSRYSTDMSVLSIKPEMVVYPLVTNDIRKILRFSWQLAEKGHTLPVTVRGGGSDLTGAGLGQGIIIDPTRHMRQIFEFDAKQKLVRLQPGVSAHTLEESLKLRGAAIPPLETNAITATVGGAIANNTATSTEFKYGRMSSWVSELEVVLANGDVLQTGKLSKRDLNRKKGLQTMEGEIYRGIDNLIEDNKDLLASIAEDGDIDQAGYPGLLQVKQRDGFDLTPLIVGSQGTLGVISEMILRSEFTSFKTSVALLVFDEKTAARDAFDTLAKLEPTFCEYIDSAYVVAATKLGKKYDWYDGAKHAKGAVVVCGFDDFAERMRTKKLKKLQKTFADQEGVTVTVGTDSDAQALLSARSAVAVARATETTDQSYPPIFDDFFIPAERFEEFVKTLDALAHKHGVSLPLYGDILSGVYSARPLLHLRRVGDKQKVFKLLDEMANLVNHHDGVLVARDGEGRLKSKFAYKHLDKEVRDLYAAVRTVFDPHSILNPGVKAETDLRSIAGSIRNEY